MTVQLTNLPHSFHSSLYSLAVHQFTKQTVITMRVHVPIYTTKILPGTYIVLSHILPTIFKTKCFNYNKYTFAEEVRNTEIGHLFEHILLTTLCSLKQTKGIYNAVYRGETYWNWKQDTFGTFHITLTTYRRDNILFTQAIAQSIGIMNQIFEFGGSLSPKVNLYKHVKHLQA